MNPDMKWLMHQMEAHYRGHSFNEPSLIETVCPLSLEHVTSTATHEGHTVWGIVLHCAYFKWKIIYSINPRAAIDYPYEKTGLPALPEKRSRRSRDETLALSDRIHDAHQAKLGNLPEGFLDRFLSAWDCTAGQAVAWLAAHDTCHNAQIRNMGVERL